MNTKYKLLFEVKEEDKSLLLWLGDTVAIPFKDLYEWRDFAEQMLGMIPEMKEGYGLEDE